MNMDYDYYIMAARQAEARSVGLWKAMNQCVRSVLETQRKKGKTLDEVADILKEIAGRRQKGEPVSINNLRIAAKQIRAREKLVLL